MKKVIIMSSVLLGVVFLVGCGQQPVSQTQPMTAVPQSAVRTSESEPAEQLAIVDGTEEWLTYKNEKYGIEFRHPEYLQFDGVETKNSTGVLFSIDANYENTGDNYFSFTINNKAGNEAGSDTGISESISLGRNMYIKKEITISDGKIILTDGIGTANYYFMDAYFKGSSYNYKFELSRPKYSKEILDLFEKIVATARFTK